MEKRGEGRLNQAKQLRAAQSMPETILWAKLRAHRTGFKFKRQVPMGGFTLDFYCHEALLDVEIDGAQHDLRVDLDRRRDQLLEAEGIKTLRFSAKEVINNPLGVAEAIRVEACLRTGETPW